MLKVVRKVNNSSDNYQAIHLEEKFYDHMRAFLLNTVGGYSVPSTAKPLRAIARAAAIGRIRAGFFAPFCAGIEHESRTARLQSSFSASANRWSSTQCKTSHTPCACQSRSRRQHVMPEPHPISGGSNSQGVPVRSTKMMPVSTARSGRRGRPPRARQAQRGEQEQQRRRQRQISREVDRSRDQGRELDL